jgi:F-type H+-transporting ATPase subunit b
MTPVSPRSTTTRRAAAALVALALALPAVALADVDDNPVEAELDHAARVTGEQVDHTHAATQHHAPPPINWVDFGWKSKDDHGGPLGDGMVGPDGDSHQRPLAPGESEEPMPPPFVLALLNFAIFVGLLVKFAGPKISAYLRNRHETIKKDLAEAARLRLEAENKLAEYSSRLAKVNAEVDQLIGEIRADADAEKARILEEARAQAAALKKDAEERISSEIARARLELEREVVAAAVAAAERLLHDKTTASDQQALFDGFVASLKPAAPGGTPSWGTPAPGTPAPAGGATDVSKGWS